jgi:hypothetical protein
MVTAKLVFSVLFDSNNFKKPLEASMFNLVWRWSMSRAVMWNSYVTSNKFNVHTFSVTSSLGKLN